MLQVEPDSFQLIEEIRYLNASRRGRAEVCRLPVLHGRMQGLPPELDALIAAADLQGIFPGPDGLANLLGLAVADRIEEIAMELELSVSRVGILLAGDLYSVPEANKRGGFGDVGAVWEAFASRFGWVAGVLGNHDFVGRNSVVSRFARSGGIHILDGDTCDLDGLQIAGVGLICGNPEKKGRRALADQLAMVELAIEGKPDILILHEGPDGSPTQPGNPEIRNIIEAGSTPLVFCGHVHWSEPLAQLRSGQVINCDSRVLILERDDRS